MEKNAKYYVIKALLSGAPLTSGKIREMLEKKWDYSVDYSTVSRHLKEISDKERCELGHFIRREKKGSQYVYEMAEKASSLTPEKAYRLCLKSDKNYTLPDAIAEFPGLKEHLDKDFRIEGEDEVKENREEKPSEKGDDHLFVVGIGSSAGGIEALKTFFENLTNDTGISFFVIIHRGEQEKDHLVGLLKRITTVNTVFAESGMKIQPDHVYVIPDNWMTYLKNNTIYFKKKEDFKKKKPMPIDFFFQSVAREYKERAVGIVLSGMGTDGTLGMQEIREELGLCITQSLESAKYESMPQSVIRSGSADFILDPREMPAVLIEYVNHITNRTEEEKTDDQFEKLLPRLFGIIQERTGQDFSRYKSSTIHRRIKRRMDVLHISNIRDYLAYLRENREEPEKLRNEMLIGVTRFFREEAAFESLKEVMLNRVFKNKSEEDNVRVWVPACSTGEEAYSIAIIIRECLDEIKREIPVQIFATDIFPAAIEEARKGVYPENIAADITEERLKRFFTQMNESLRVNKQIREMIVFAPQNVINDPPFTKIDLLSCRNFLIYIDSGLQNKVLPIFHYALKKDGILFLGSSESIGSFTDLFEIIDKREKIYRRREDEFAKHKIAEFPIPRKTVTIPKPEKPKPKEEHIYRLHQNILLNRHTPPSLIVNNEGEILSVHGQTSKFLELPQGGQTQNNIVEMAKEPLKIEISHLLRSLKKEEGEYESNRVPVKVNSDFHFVVVHIFPLKEKTDRYLMTFHDAGLIDKTEGINGEYEISEDDSQKVRELKEELSYTQEYLQTTIEELETSNEELKSTNEELQSTNEELQSANEELETTKEEQESMNEELITVNSELQKKIEELYHSSNHMHNLLESLKIPTIFLDNELKIKRFTSRAKDLIRVIENDINRPLDNISTNLKDVDLAREAHEVLQDLNPKKFEIRTDRNHWYEVSIRPYKTLENVIEGVVITFVDIHEKKSLENKTELLQEYWKSVMDVVREPVIVLDDKLNIIEASVPFYEMFPAKSRKTIGKSIYKIGEGIFDVPGIKELLEKTIPEKENVLAHDIYLEFSSAEKKRFLVNACRLKGNKEQGRNIILAMEKVNE